LVRERSGGGYEVVVANWDAVGSVPATEVASRASVVAEDDSPHLEWELADQDRLFEALEGRWNQQADKVALDVFSLGAVAFYVFAGQRLPAPDEGALRERLRRDGGLDLSAELPQVSAELRASVLAATHPQPAQRTGSVAQFLQQVERARMPAAEPAEPAEEDPLEAGPGAVLGPTGQFTYVRTLGSG